MKRKIILFLLNLIGGNKNQENEEGKRARRTGCGCLLAIAFAPFLPILLFIIIIVWVSSSLMSCMAPVVLSDVFGVEITEEDEKMLRGEYQEQKERYGGVQEYFEKKKLHDTAGLAQSFYILYMGQVLSRPDGCAGTDEETEQEGSIARERSEERGRNLWKYGTLGTGAEEVAIKKMPQR